MKPSTGGTRIRITELARSAGLSVQQIRNYVTLGMLPPADRAPNGYRVFTTRHGDALATARTLIAGHGWPAAVEMLSAVHRGDPATALSLVDRSHGELDRERVHVRSVLDALDGDLPERFRIHRPLRIADAAAAIGARASALRVWERRGLLAPGRERVTGYRLYDQRQLTMARVVVLLRRSGYSLDAVGEVMAAMVAGDPARTRTALASRQRDLDRASVERARGTAALYRYLETSGALGSEPMY
ncbi:MerR family transcriptional regulator [Virgisporangium ochraceum]|uniref:MerR family transcriptional regulator n=1 Tax=Virgisporangium ochraceum TaxID=65505 RepID=A0A8J4EGP8_9ACTN|nr:MerR family transcriptional regulator [Virgisporangium ochraceum]GIJ73918.1 MerR family transcriptional regulator [Virgisporangium ochraceum]